MTMVTLRDGRRVPSDSRDYLLECEAVEFWRQLQSAGAREHLDGMKRKRGEAGVKRILDRIATLEPWLVLDLPTKAQRQAYAARVERKRGKAARLALEEAVKAAFRQRKQQQTPDQPAQEAQ